MNPEEAKIRKTIANEIRQATPLYAEVWSSTYAHHFNDAAHLVELGHEEWARRLEDDTLPQ